MGSKRWDATAHEALLMACIEEIKPSKAFLLQVTERMNNMGFDYTFHGIKYCAIPAFTSQSSCLYMHCPEAFANCYNSQHIQKLRRNRDVSGLEASNSAASTPKKATQADTSATAKKRPAAAAPRKAAKKTVPGYDEEDVLESKALLKKELDEENGETKRVKTQHA
jgi:hypothetical protein